MIESLLSVAGFILKQDKFLRLASDNELEHNSLPSADDGSSGYESFKMYKEGDR